jgi:hypothetical protein
VQGEVAVSTIPETDLEAGAGLELDPEYVLVFMPSFLCASTWRRLTEPSYWELFTVAEYASALPCRDDWRTPDHPAWTVPLLAGWVRDVLGFPVALEPGSVEIRADRAGARWRSVPLYWVRRNT